MFGKTPIGAKKESRRKSRGFDGKESFGHDLNKGSDSRISRRSHITTVRNSNKDVKQKPNQKPGKHTASRKPKLGGRPQVGSHKYNKDGSRK
jgi:hypothetical protein